MKQCRRIVNWTLKNNLQWNLNQYLTIFIQHYDFEKDVCNMVAICLGLNVMIIRRNLKSRKSEICAYYAYNDIHWIWFSALDIRSKLLFGWCISLKLQWEQKELSIKFELRWKNRWWHGPLDSNKPLSINCGHSYLVATLRGVISGHNSI